MAESTDKQLQALIASLGDLAAKADKGEFLESREADGFERSAPTEAPVFEPVVPIVATVHTVVAQMRQPPSFPLPHAESELLVPSTTPVPGAIPTTIPVVVGPVQLSSSSAAGAVAGAGPSSKSIGPLAQSTQNSTSSRKRLKAAAAPVIVVGLLAGGFLVGRRNQSAAPVTEVAVAPPATRLQPLGETQVKRTPTPRAARSTTESPAATVPSKVLTRDAVPFAGFAAPTAKRPATTDSGEPPPLLSTPNGAAEETLGASLLAGSVPVAPEPPGLVPTASPSASIGGQLQEPRVVLSSAPIYPPDARRLQIQGIVVLNVLVDETGKVTEAKIVSGPVFLQQAAMDSVRKWKYQPARLDGQPIAIHINVGVNFSLR